MAEMRIAELAIVIVVYIIWFAMGVYYARRALFTEKEYLVAGHKVPGWVTALASLAVFASAGSYMGSVGVAYKLEILSWWILTAGAIVGWLFALTLTGPYFRKAKTFTISEFLNYRYNSKLLVLITATAVVIGYLFYMVSQIKAIGIVGEYLLGVPYEYGILIALIVFATYTAFGGMPSVTYTQAIQGLIMIVVIIPIAFWALIVVGGFSGVSQIAANYNPKLLSIPNPVYTPWTYLGGFLIWVCAIPAMPDVVMRFAATRTVREVQLSVAALLVIYGIWMTLLIGLSALAIASFPPGTPEALKQPDFAIFAVLDKFQIPSIVGGLFALGVLSAAMSTISGMILASVAALTRDILPIVKQVEERTKLKINIVLAWIIGIAVLIFALNPPPLLVILYTVGQGVISVTVFLPTLFGIWWKRFNKYGAIASAGVGSIVYIALYFSQSLPLYAEFVVAILLSLISGIGVTYLTPPPDKETIEKIEALHK